MNKNYIPIVFATDDGYALPTAVAITSLIKNKNKDTNYKIYLISPGLSKDNKKKLKSLANKSCVIKIIYAADLLTDKASTLEKVSSTDYYRLMLDSILPNENKIIALDGDLLILSDLTELYNIELSDNYIAGVYFRPHDVYNRTYVQNVLGLDEGKRINIGVMLMDLKKIRERNIQTEFLKNIGKFDVMSEDIINFVCKDKIKYIPLKYNYNLHYYKFYNLLAGDPIYDINEYHAAEKEPVIFHYTLEKPWKTDVIHRQKLWFDYKKQSPYKNIKVYGEEPFLHRLFSIKNYRNCQKIYKRIQILGLKINIRNKKRELEEQVKDIYQNITNINNKLDTILEKQNLLK